MATSILPTRGGSRSQIDWTAVVANAKPGDILTLPIAAQSNASNQITRHGGHCRTRRIGSEVRIEFLAPPARAAAALPASGSHLHPAYQMARLRNRIQSTQDQIAHWKTQSNERETHAGRTEAGALVLLYESQLRVLRKKLNTLLTPDP